MKEIVKTHVGSYAVIVKDNKIALIKKARGGYKGKYDLPGGGIEHDETPLEGLYRECQEEIGREVKQATLLDTTSVTFKWQMTEDTIEDLHHIGILYQVKLDNENLKEDADGLDSLGAEWKEIENLTEDITSPFTWYALKKLGYK